MATPTARTLSIVRGSRTSISPSSCSGQTFRDPVEARLAEPTDSMLEVVGGVMHSMPVAQLDSAERAECPVTCKRAAQASRLALAYEYDPYFTVSNARVD